MNILTVTSGKEETIWNLVVCEEYRRLGIASKLMIKAEKLQKLIEMFVEFGLFNRIQLVMTK